MERRVSGKPLPPDAASRDWTQRARASGGARFGYHCATAGAICQSGDRWYDLAAPDMPLNPDELRSDVRRALESSPLDSVKVSCAFAAGLAGICALLGGGLAALNAFSRGWLIAFGLITAGAAGQAMLILELFRLSRRSRLLQQLLDSEKYYESLLESARAERDTAQKQLREAQTRFDVFVAAREVVRIERTGPRVGELPPGPPEEEQQNG
jgi:hypothetical protein